MPALGLLRGARIAGLPGQLLAALLLGRSPADVLRAFHTLTSAKVALLACALAAARRLLT